MPVDFNALDGKARILIEADLKPVAGTRIQPTGFPDLGPATYEAPPSTDQERKEYPNGVPTLLVESAQSMANRLEAVCWDEATEDVVAELKGLPYVKVKLAGLSDGQDTTCSLLEFHRLNSPYIMSGYTKNEIKLTLKQDGDEAVIPVATSFADVLKPQLGLAMATAKKAPAKTKTEDAPADDGAGDKERDDVAGVVNLRKLAAVCFKYDPNSLVHGVFLEKIAGRLRHPRALSAFIEASGVGRADSGGVKFDRVLPKPKVADVDASGGYGNVPFHRTEFTAKTITAFFSIDLAQIRGYGLADDATKLLIVLSLWKVRKFLDSNMRLRTACELELSSGEKSINVRRPELFVLSSAPELSKEIRGLIEKTKPHFADPCMTELNWTGGKKGVGKVDLELPPDFPEPAPFPEPLKERIQYKKKTKTNPAKLILKKGLSPELIVEIEGDRPDDKQLIDFLRSNL